MSMWLAVPMLVCLAVAFGGLAVWGLSVRSLTLLLEARHPETFAALRARSRRPTARMAVTGELQSDLFRAKAPPALLSDPAAAPLLARERAARVAAGAGACGAVAFFVLAASLD